MRNRTTVYGVALGAALALTAAPASAQTGAPGAETQQPAQGAEPRVADTMAGAATALGAAEAETRYTLVQVGGKDLPVEVEKEWRCREEVTAGSLTLQGDRWRLETSKRETCGDRTREDRDTDDGLYRREGNTLRFLDDDGGPNENDDRDEIELDDLRTGTVGAEGTLTVELSDGNRVVFRPEGR